MIDNDKSQTGLLPRFVCIDFEASGLGPKSFPTEIGFACPATGDVWSRLIKPHPIWLAEGEWNEESEAMTGLTRAILAKHGDDPWRVYRDAMTIIDGRAILSDNPCYDRKWFASLVAAAVDGPGHEDDKVPVLLDLAIVAWETISSQGRDPDLAWSKAELEVGLRFSHPHRAGPDARYNAELLRHISAADINGPR